MRTNRLLTFAALLLAALPIARSDPALDDPGVEESVPPARQAREDAWWTGPLLAASAGTLAPGHFLIEPYVFDVIPQGRYDNDGRRRPAAAHSNTYGSQSYLLYGLFDRVGVGLIPRFSHSEPGAGAASSGIRVGDLTLQGQYALTSFQEGTWIPSTSFVFQETLPTGRYDRLGDRPADGTGAGAYSTTLAIYSQYFFWMPNGRILRTRLDLSYSISGSAGVRDVSVYGTGDGFNGRARPGNVAVANVAFEYSVTRRWVLALDVLYEHDGNTHVHGLDYSNLGGPAAVDFNSGTGHTWSLAPAVEYNFNSRVGVIAGAKVTVAGRNATALVIPVAAINIVI